MIQSLPEVVREVGGGMVPPRVSRRVDSPFCLSPALAQECEHTWNSVRVLHTLKRPCSWDHRIIAVVSLRSSPPSYTLAFTWAVASALPGPVPFSRLMFSFPAPTLPVSPPDSPTVWLPCLWISLARSPGHWASSSSPLQPRPLSQLLPCLERARPAPFGGFPGQLLSSPLHRIGIRRRGGEEGLGQR